MKSKIGETAKKQIHMIYTVIKKLRVLPGDYGHNIKAGTLLIDFGFWYTWQTVSELTTAL